MKQIVQLLFTIMPIGLSSFAVLSLGRAMATTFVRQETGTSILLAILFVVATVALRETLRPIGAGIRRRIARYRPLTLPYYGHAQEARLHKAH